MIAPEEIREKIILALDVDSIAKASPIVKALAPLVGSFKVGLELLSSAGAPTVIQSLSRLGGRIFFDGKFNDIPNTVGSASRAVAKQGCSYFTVHASSGPEALKEAVANKSGAKCLAVTVLTSLDEAVCQDIFGSSPQQKVMQFARDAALAGVDGVVCSAQELEWLSQEDVFQKLLKVTPGIRPEWASVDDQKRTMTPGEAIAAGATHLVIGRPILNPPAGIGSPIDALKKIYEEIATASGIALEEQAAKKE